MSKVTSRTVICSSDISGLNHDWTHDVEPRRTKCLLYTFVVVDLSLLLSSSSLSASSSSSSLKRYSTTRPRLSTSWCHASQLPHCTYTSPLASACGFTFLFVRASHLSHVNSTHAVRRPRSSTSPSPMRPMGVARILDANDGHLPLPLSPPSSFRPHPSICGEHLRVCLHVTRAQCLPAPRTARELTCRGGHKGDVRATQVLLIFAECKCQLIGIIVIPHNN